MLEHFFCDDWLENKMFYLFSFSCSKFQLEIWYKKYIKGNWKFPPPIFPFRPSGPGYPAPPPPFSWARPSWPAPPSLSLSPLTGRVWQNLLSVWAHRHLSLSQGPLTVTPGILPLQKSDEHLRTLIPPLPVEY